MCGEMTRRWAAVQVGFQMGGLDQMFVVHERRTGRTVLTVAHPELEREMIARLSQPLTSENLNHVPPDRNLAIERKGLGRKGN